MPLLSRRATYGLRAMCALAHAAETGEAVTIASLATADGLPRKYLERIIGQLAAAGLIRGKPGPGGGCRLTVPADQISVLAIVEALEGPTAPAPCFSPESEASGEGCEGCRGLTRCAVHEMLARVQNSVDRELSGVNLAQLAARQREMSAQPQ
ncbi:MAG: Rrf2 family transcriptional regulator [Armatimonadetes bacterium]|nr:Rrf2 family transcriptional regulator [Armatimonadota bacterium]MDI9582999.1 Rrf2 family transcriptional regulator [Acidobacteriota bacterium]